MANSSIHIQGGSGGSVTHNSRETFSYSVVFKDEHNELWNDSKEAFKIYRDELNIRSQAYTERTGQKLQKNVLTQLSAVVNLEQHHTLKDLEPIKKHLEKTFDTKVFQMSIHRDEGKLTNKQDENIKLVSGEDFFLNAKDNKLYFDKQFKKEINMEDWNIEKNYHAHIEFMGLDSLGNGIKRNYMNIRTLSNIQTFVAKDLNMQRGNQSVIIKENGEMERDFSNRKKRQDTHPFKQNKKVENDAYLKASKELLATKKDLQDANNQLRTFMKENGALRTDFAQLEQAKKELEEKLKAKELTIEEMESKFKELESLVFSKKVYKETKEKVPFKEVAEHYESKNKEVNAKIEEVAEVLQSPKDLTFFEWIKNKFQELKEKIFKLENENEKLKNENLNLKERVNSLIDEKCELLKELGEPTKVKNDFKEEIHQKGLNLLSSLSVEEKIATFKDREVDYKKVQEKIKEQKEELQRVQQRKM